MLLYLNILSFWRFDLRGGNLWLRLFSETSNATEGDLMCMIRLWKTHTEVHKKSNPVKSNLLKIKEYNMLSNGLQVDNDNYHKLGICMYRLE